MMSFDGETSCEFPIKEGPAGDRLYNLYKFKEGFRWTAVEVSEYKKDEKGFSQVIRQAIAGHKGENLQFHFRYFEVSPGGYTTYERHNHEHLVVCIRGRGKVRLGDSVEDMDFLDVLYIGPNMPHQLFNPYKEPFGFFCIVNSDRDRPQPIEGDSICKEKG